MVKELAAHLGADALSPKKLALARFLMVGMRSCARHADRHRLRLIMAEGATRVYFPASRTELAGLWTACPASLVASHLLVALVLLLRRLLLESTMVSLGISRGCEYGPMLILHNCLLLLLLRLNTMRELALVPFLAVTVIIEV